MRAQPPPSSDSAEPDVEPEVRGRVEMYADDDRTTVWRPRVTGAVERPEGFRVGASWMADVVSSASIDVLTRASKPIEETRHEMGVRGAWLGRDSAELSVGYLYGFEPDHASHTLSLGAAADLDEARLWNGSAALALSQARIGTVVDERFEEHSRTVALSARLARVVNPRTVLRGGLELAGVFGFQASPYRTVRLGDWTAMPYSGDDPDATPWVFSGVTGVVRESHPERRLRARVVVDGVRALGERAAIQGAISGYVDDWGMLAGTLRGELRWEPHRVWMLRFGLRAYLQDAVWFWRRRYIDGQETRGHVTDDKELGPLRSFSALAAVAATFEPFALGARVELVRYAYPEFTLLPHKHALIVQLGVTYRP
ncbi:MAG: DUF3570 domain-containing protein [Myxococcota bacterium]